MSLTKSLDNVHWFNDLITGIEEPPMVEIIKSFPTNSVLDIGCGDGRTLLNIYYAVGADHLEGAELRNETTLVEDFNGLLDEGMPRVDSLKRLWLTGTPSTWDAKAYLRNPRQVSHIMRRLQFGTNILDYRPALSKYDIIISSHVIHQMNELELARIGQMFREHAHHKSLIYYSMKPEYGMGQVPIRQVLGMACELANDLSSLGVKQYSGAEVPEGSSIIFTNMFKPLQDPYAFKPQ